MVRTIIVVRLRFTFEVEQYLEIPQINIAHMKMVMDITEDFIDNEFFLDKKPTEAF